MGRLHARVSVLFQMNIQVWQGPLYREQTGDQQRREQVARHVPRAVRRNEQVIDGVKAGAGSEDARRAGQRQPAASEHIGNTKARQNPTEDVNRTGGDPANEQKGKVLRTVLRQVTHVFKGGKAHGNSDGRRRQLFWLRLEDQKVEQQRQQLHHFLADRRDLNGGNCGIHAVIPHEKAADVGTQQTNAHADGEKQRKAAGAAFREEQGQNQRNGKTDKDIFDIGHFSATSRKLRISSATRESVSIMSTAK